MQTLQLVILATAVAASLVIISSRRHGELPNAKLIGLAIGLLTAFVVLVRSTDLVPDLFEDELGEVAILAIVMLVATAAVVLSVIYTQRP